MFFPPSDSPGVMNSLYLMVIISFFWIAYTAYIAPYQALIPELSRNDRERVGITTWQALFSIIGVILGMLVIPRMWGSFMDSGIQVSTALRITLGVFCLIGMALMFAAAFAVDERRYASGKPSTTGIRDSIRLTFKNSEFRIFLAGTIAFWFGFNIMRKGALYYVTVLLGREESDLSIVLGQLLLVSLLCFPVANVTARRFGKKKVFVIGLFAFATLMPFIYFIDRMGFAFSLVLFALIGIPVGIREVVPNAMLADICDLDAQRTGQQREAIFFGVQGFFNKLNIGLSTGFFLLLLGTFGKDPGNDLGIRLTGPVSAIFCLVGAIIFLRYPEMRKPAERPGIIAD
jgi:GPH family glycoside/pentoside/hexuronide:cation symporter